MYKSILVPLFGVARDAEALACALKVATPFGAHLDCLHVCPDPRTTVATLSGSMGNSVGDFSQDLWDAVVEADKDRAKAARMAFDAFRKTRDLASEADSGPSASFREIEGDPSRDITANARYADLAVVTRAGPANASWDAAGDVIVNSGRPVILSCPPHSGTIGATIVIAWKETAEAARAVTAAMPLLGRAKEIVVLAGRERAAVETEAVESANRLVALLRRHGMSARAETVEPDGNGLSGAIVERALFGGCDLLVMGAYGHSRMREFVFGGLTRHILTETRIPIFLLH